MRKEKKYGDDGHNQILSPCDANHWATAFNNCPAASLAAIAIITLTLCNGFFNAIAVAVGANFPYTTFLFHPNDLFADLLKVALSYPGPAIINVNHWVEPYRGFLLSNPYHDIEGLSSGALTHLHLPPLTTLVYLATRHLIASLGYNAIIAIFSAIWFIPLLLIVFGKIREKPLAFLSCTAIIISYPVLMTFTRGNIGAVITGLSLIMAAILTYEGKSPITIAFLLAIALNVRPNTIIFLLLPFIGFNIIRAIRISFLSGLFAGFIFFGTLFLAHIIYQDYTFSNFREGFLAFYNLYYIGNAGLAYGSSLYGLIKVIAHSLRLKINLDLAAQIAYSLSIILLLSAMISFWMKLIDKRVALFVICATYTLGSNHFGDYHLVAFLICFLVYAIGEPKRIHDLTKPDKIVLLATILILAPKNYIFGNDISAQVLLNPAILLRALIAILRNAWLDSRLSSSQPIA